jgi:hypothetical protein
MRYNSNSYNSISNPTHPLDIIHTVNANRDNSVLATTLAQNGGATFGIAMAGRIEGQSNTGGESFRGLQGTSNVNNVGTIANNPTNIGVAGFADSSYNNTGLFGRAGEFLDTTSGFNTGVFAQAEGSQFINRGVEAASSANGLFNQGVFGISAGAGDGTTNSENTGIFGFAQNNLSNNFGVSGLCQGLGTGFNIRVVGQALGTSGATTNYGIFGFAANGGTDYAGFFQGDVNVTGTLSKAGGTFKIDHPLDPANKYLVHSFVESPDMMNVYNGNTTTDVQGYSTITLPDYFEAANKDFKYQLTVIGTFAQAIIAKKLENNQFVIQTDKPGVEVSWQITGVRNDPWAQENRFETEPVKQGKEAGKYVHPALYDQPADMGMPTPSLQKESVSSSPNATTSSNRSAQKE